MKIKSKNIKIPLLVIALCLIVAGGTTSAVVRYLNSDERNQPLVFSDNTMLYELWEDYKDKFIEEGTYRAIDRSQNDITTSEGQSYSMLRAVWMDDRTTFDKSWQWTKDNLQREPDKLLSWRFGPLGNGQYGIQTDMGGENTASDADVDIALSLLMAYSRWNESGYLADAKPLINSIWEQEVVTIAGKPVLAANNVEKNSGSDAIIVNPSYFAPYAFKLFDEVDKNSEHTWTALADNSYVVLNQAIDSPLDKARSAGLPPDWIRVNRTTGQISTPGGSLTSNYSYDALRTPWRLALDWQWFNDERAKTTLAKMDFLQGQWNSEQKLYSSYTHDGNAMTDYEKPSTYGGSVGYFAVIQPNTAKEVYNRKLTRVYDPDAQAARANLDYYDANWSWFGIALMQGALPNLTETD